MSKSKEIKQDHLVHIREIFSKRESLKDIKNNIDSAKNYLYENVEKLGVFAFATKIMNGANVEYNEENMLACSLFNELNHQKLSDILGDNIHNNNE